MTYNVLNGAGSVEHMTSTPLGDLLVVNAARCSFDKEHEEFDNEKDTKLINFLAREKHLLPFRHPTTTLRIIAPIYVFRQLGKHQVGFSWSEVSRRYIKTEPTFHTPLFRRAASNVKQGSSDELLHPDMRSELQDHVDLNYEDAVILYNRMLDEGVAPEQCRVVLPQAMITTTVTTGSLLGWHHMYKERTSPTTQRETQEYARAIGEIMSVMYPISWRALCEH